jgi:hypothetical protein
MKTRLSCDSQGYRFQRWASVPVCLRMLLLLTDQGYAMSLPKQVNERASAKARLEVTLDTDFRTRYALNLKLTNQSDKVLSVYEHSLPWKGLHSITLVAVETDNLGSRVLDKVDYIDDPGPGITQIKPGQSLTGQIILPKRFPDIVASLKRHDVIVFWTYQVVPVEGVDAPRSIGWVMVPRTTQK